MRIIDNGYYRKLVPDEGYKLVNKTNGIEAHEFLLGKFDSEENYTEIVDDKYVSINVKISIDELTQLTNTLAKAMDDLVKLLGPILSMIPKTAEMDSENEFKDLGQVYVELVKKGLRTQDEVPDIFKEYVKKILD